MIKIKTTADELFNFIEEHSPVKESKLPKAIKKLEVFEKHLHILETSGLIEIEMKLLSADRTFIFKSRERSKEHDPWVTKPLSF